MRKQILLLILISVSFSIRAQKTDENYSTAYYKTSPSQSSFVKVKFEGENNSSNIQKYLQNSLENLKDNRAGLKLNYRNESPGGFHYSFTQLFNGIEVYQSEIKVNTDKQNTIHSLFDNSENTSKWNISIENATENSVIAIHPSTKQFVLAERKIENHSREILIANEEIFFSRDLRMYMVGDSVVSGRVFNPDPLTTAGQVYGGIYVDNGDAYASWLDAQKQTVNFIAHFNGSQFSLENSYVRVSDFDLPTIAPVTSTVPQFDFNRSQSGFEDVNAFYHVSTMHNHIQSLGFNAADALVEIDPHAMSGADNSFFLSSTSPKKIYYGTGGVDDAEDADVCVHEYGHFVSDGAAPGSNVGFERNALDEAFGDYLAGSYSRSLNTFNEDWVFNWDGHNEFWNGRILNSTKVYPQDLDGSSYYKNSSIWSAVLMCINSSIGRAATDSLILQAHYSFAQNILMDEAALLLIDADTLLTGGKYYCSIYNCLFQHGLNPANPFSPCGVGVNELNEFAVKFFNHTNSFSVINANLYDIKIAVLNINGQVVAILNDSKAMLNYENENLASGIYIVNVSITTGTTAKLSKTFKWSKVN